MGIVRYYQSPQCSVDLSEVGMGINKLLKNLKYLVKLLAIPLSLQADKWLVISKARRERKIAT
jgi:hypothetical protein